MSHLSSVPELDDGWTVHVEAAGSPDGRRLDESADRLVALLERYGGVVSVAEDGGRFGATFSVREPNLDLASALSLGYELFRDLATRAGFPDYPLVRGEVMTFAEHDADLAR